MCSGLYTAKGYSSDRLPHPKHSSAMAQRHSDRSIALLLANLDHFCQDAVQAAVDIDTLDLVSDTFQYLQFF